MIKKMGRKRTKRACPGWYESRIKYLKRRTKEVNGCWIWQGGLNSRGYGLAYFKKISNTKLVHRIMYILTKGKIPDNLPLDHLCRNKACINPGHLEPITPQEHAKRAILQLVNKEDYQIQLGNKINPINWELIGAAFVNYHVKLL